MITLCRAARRVVYEEGKEKEGKERKKEEIAARADGLKQYVCAPRHLCGVAVISSGLSRLVLYIRNGRVFK
jgi:hypothetical protein